MLLTAPRVASLPWPEQHRGSVPGALKETVQRDTYTGELDKKGDCHRGSQGVAPAKYKEKYLDSI